jgi:copper chaperone CopZ
MHTMLKMKQFTAVLAFLLSTVITAQNQSAATKTFQVSGNCGMCKKTIEKAARIPGVKSAVWDVKTKNLVLTYNEDKTNPEQVLREVAYAGYDNELYVAPDNAYNDLHGCCKYKRSGKAQQESKNATSEHKHNEDPKEQVANENTGDIKKIYEQYFAIKDALVNTNSGAAASAAEQLLALLKNADTRSLDKKEQDAFNAQETKLSEHALTIAGKKKIEDQRQAFSKLSSAMHALMKSIKPGYEVYVDHCPMYDDGKGANWLSREKPIRNPYYGSKMMSCGNVKGTLK